MNALASFEISGRRVGPDAPPFVIAEMWGNRNQSLERARSRSSRPLRRRARTR